MTGGGNAWRGSPAAPGIIFVLSLMSAFSFAVAVGLGAVFVASAVAKLRTRNFVSTVEDYRLLPRIAVRPIGLLLPWFEAAVGVAMVVGVAPALSLWAAAGLLIVFAIAMAVNLVRGRRLACGCQGDAETPIGCLSGLRNGVFAVMAASSAMVGPVGGLRVLSSGTPGLGRDGALAILLALVALAVVWHLIESAHRLVQQVRRLKWLDEPASSVASGVTVRIEK